MKSGLGVAFLAILLVPQEPLEDRVRAIVGRLAAEGIEDREQASKDLLALGLPALSLLERRLESTPEGEVRTRIKSVVERLRRMAKVAELSPPVRLVTASAKETPLRSLLADLGRQSQVVVECADGVADRPVTLEIKREPVLQAIDRICLGRGDLVAVTAEGKVKVTAGAPVKTPTAYADGFRFRLRKSAVHEVGDFGKRRTDIVLHAVFDAQPDQRFKSVAQLPECIVTSPEGESLKMRNGGGLPVTSYMSTGAKNYAVVDDVMVSLDEGDQLELTLILKEAPAGLKSLGLLRVRARYRFSVGLIPASATLTGSKRASTLGDTPYAIHMGGGRNVYFYAATRPGQPVPPQLPDLVDMDSLVIVDSSGKENRLTLQPARGRGTQYSFQSERELKDEEMTLKYNLLDAVDQDVEFELKDVKLRD